MEYHVYELFDQEGTIVYVGMSINPKRRFAVHTKTKPNPIKRKGYGYFYGRTDLAWQIISSHEIKSDALKAEGARKLQLGMTWTEKCGLNRKGGRIGGKIGGKINGTINGTKSQSYERICPHCLRIIKGSVYFRYHGDSCKLKP